jgi:hypothetical protein
VKTLIKLAIVALVANATWHLLIAYTAYYKFKDGVESAAQFSNGRSEDQLRSRILELASQFDVPVTEANFTLQREGNHTVVDGSFVRRVDLLPFYSYPWPFAWHVDTFTFDQPGSGSNR